MIFVIFEFFVFLYFCTSVFLYFCSFVFLWIKLFSVRTRSSTDSSKESTECGIASVEGSYKRQSRAHRSNLQYNCTRTRTYIRSHGNFDLKCPVFLDTCRRSASHGIFLVYSSSALCIVATAVFSESYTHGVSQPSRL